MPFLLIILYLYFALNVFIYFFFSHFREHRTGSQGDLTRRLEIQSRRTKHYTKLVLKFEGQTRT